MSTQPEGVGLSEDELGTDPIAALITWVDEARAAGVGDEPVLTLATVDATGAPDARLVIVRAIDDRGLTFYNDTRSPKGRQLAREPRAAMVGYWPSIGRQVRLRGRTEIVPSVESDAAFRTRERQSQIGYWANRQSVPIADRAALERQQDETAARFEGRRIPRPAHWVCYRLRPDYIEFWQAGARHLHDRIAYSYVGAAWHAERLQP